MKLKDVLATGKIRQNEEVYAAAYDPDAEASIGFNEGFRFIINGSDLDNIRIAYHYGQTSEFPEDFCNFVLRAKGYKSKEGMNSWDRKSYRSYP